MVILTNLAELLITHNIFTCTWDKLLYLTLHPKKADPGFPRRSDGINTYYLVRFLSKTALKWRKLNREGSVYKHRWNFLLISWIEYDVNFWLERKDMISLFCKLTPDFHEVFHEFIESKFWCRCNKYWISMFRQFKIQQPSNLNIRKENLKYIVNITLFNLPACLLAGVHDVMG